MNKRDLTCEQVIERIFVYLDRELDAAQSSRIDRHLQKCRDCFSRAEFEKQLRARVRDAGTVETPERVHRRIRRLLDQF